MNIKKYIPSGNETPAPVKAPQSTCVSRRSGQAKSRLAGGVDVSSLIVIVIVLISIAVAIFFIVRNGNLKSQLTQSRSDSSKQVAELQSLLESANAKLKESTNEFARFESAAGQARAEAARAKESAEAATGQVADLQRQLEIAKRMATEAKSNMDKSAAEVVKLRAQLQAQLKAQPASTTTTTTTTTTKPAAVEKPAPTTPNAAGVKSLPLEASFTKAPMLDGIALSLQNKSDASLSLTVRFSNSSDSKEIAVTLDPGATKAVGWLGAWVLASGDKAEIMCPGFETITKTAP